MERKGRGKYPAMERELYEGILQHARDESVELAALVRRADTTLSAKALSAGANWILARTEPGASVSEKWVSHFKEQWGLLSTRLAPAAINASTVSGGGSSSSEKGSDLLEQKVAVLEKTVAELEKTLQQYESLEQKVGVLEEKVAGAKVLNASIYKNVQELSDHLLRPASVTDVQEGSSPSMQHISPASKMKRKTKDYAVV